MSDRRKRPAPDTALGWLGLSDSPNWAASRPLGRLIGLILVAALPLLFFGGLLAAGFVLYDTVAGVLEGDEQGLSFGAGALIAALLGAPFLIWGTVIRQKTLDIQQEGHMTDRISKAVEQLGAEKTVRRHLVNSKGKKVKRSITKTRKQRSRIFRNRS